MKVKDNKEKNKNLVISAAFFSISLIILFIASVTNFATGKFEWDRLKDEDFIYNYALTASLSIIMLVLTIIWKRFKHKMSLKITDVIEEIKALKNFIEVNNLREKFKKHLEIEKNIKNKIEKYKKFLSNKISHYENKLELYKCKKYKLKFLNAKIEIKKSKMTEYIAFYKGKQFSAEKDINDNKIHVKVKAYTENLIFGNYSGETDEGGVFYSGVEGLFIRVFPSLFIGLIFTCFLYAFVPMFKDGITWESVLYLAIRLCSMLAYSFNGALYANFSILDVFYTALCNRRGEVMTFLSINNMPVIINENEHYKYKVEPLKSGQPEKSETKEVIENG